MIKPTFLALSLSLLGSAYAESLLDVSFVSNATTVKATAATPTLQSWMHTDVQSAWKSGYTGQGVNAIIVDDFSSAQRFAGQFTGAIQTQRHGDWTSLETSLISPGATINKVDFYKTKTLTLKSGTLNTVNASFGLMAAPGYNTTQVLSSNIGGALVTAAQQGKAVITKAAGNNGGVAVNGVINGTVDYLNLGLKGAPSAIFVGALDKNGSPTAKANMASYSNIAGSDTTIQKQFLVVGVEGTKTGLYGTSFAAPIVQGYSNILGSKFKTATATQITNQLLNTARTDTINNYKVSVHGRGEASLSRALATNIY